MKDKRDNEMIYFLYFIGGIMVGGTVAVFILAATSTRRISYYEQMNEKQQLQIRKLTDSLPKESQKNILGIDLCVCCGEAIPEGQMVCTRCSKITARKAAAVTFF